MDDARYDKLSRRIWEIEQKLGAYGKSADWSDQVDIVFSKQHEIKKTLESLEFRMQMLEAMAVRVLKKEVGK